MYSCYLVKYNNSKEGAFLSTKNTNIFLTEGYFNEYPQDMFSWRNKIKYLPDTPSHLKLWKIKGLNSPEMTDSMRN